MSFDKNLPIALINKLYSDVLYNVEEVKVHVSETKTSISYIGDNNKYISILVNYDGTKIIPPDQLKFLLGILSACKLKPEDVAIINYKKPLISIEQIFSELSPRAIMAFNIEPVKLKLPQGLATLSVHEIDDVNFILAPALDSIRTDLPLKKQLWLALRKLFDI